MPAFYRKGNETTVPHVPVADVTAGTMIAIGTTSVRIAHHDIPANDQHGQAACGGSGVLYEITKDTAVGSAFNDDQIAYLDEANQLASNSDAGGTRPPIGPVKGAASDADTSVIVRHD